MTIATNQQLPNNGAPATGVSVPAVVPESASATTTPGAGSATSPELSLVRETLANTSPAKSGDGVKVGGTDDVDVDARSTADQFAQLDKDFDLEDVVEVESGQLETGTPAAPAVVATPASPAAAAPVAAPVVPAVVPQPAAAAQSVQGQPNASVNLPPEYPDLFAPVTQPVATPTVQPSAPVVADAQSTPVVAAQAAAGETDEQRLVRLRGEYMGNLEKSYAFSEDEARAVMLEPEKVLPQKFAKMHTEMLEAATAGILQQLPAIVQQTILGIRNQYQLNQSFYTAWPKLANPEHANTVRGLLQAYRQQNPNANWDQTVREVGATAMVALRLPLSPDMVGMQAAQPGTSRAMPVTPANPGGGSPLTKPTTDNPFEALNNEWDSEETMPDS